MKRVILLFSLLVIISLFVSSCSTGEAFYTKSFRNVQPTNQNLQIGQVQWLEANYPATGLGVVRVTDLDLNLDPNVVENKVVKVWSDSDNVGITLNVIETGVATATFEGTVSFITTGQSSGNTLRVAEGDTITANYEDSTLPNPYATSDKLDIAGTSIIGTIAPPLEGAPAANPRTVDAFGDTLEVKE
jgi:FtsP/CotA-like multicopper oxidase with cupredoxin domain